jgi:hypothetical protein
MVWRRGGVCGVENAMDKLKQQQQQQQMAPQSGREALRPLFNGVPAAWPPRLPGPRPAFGRSEMAFWPGAERPAAPPQGPPQPPRGEPADNERLDAGPA